MSLRAPVRPTTGPAEAPPSPNGSRAARPRWLDARLLVGAGLVLASVLFGARVVAGSDDTVAVWAARTALSPGQALSTAALEVRQVRLDDASAYVGADPGAPGAVGGPGGWVVVRVVGPGELLPRAAVRESGAVEVRYVTVALPRDELPWAVAPGARVEVWTAPTGSDAAVAPVPGASGGERGSTAPAPAATTPRRLLGPTTVQEVVVADATFGGATTTVPVVLAVRADQAGAGRTLDALIGEVLDAARAARLYLVGLPAAGD